MAIEFLCTTCGTTLKVPDEHAGKQAKCPKCQALNVIPAKTPTTMESIPLAKPMPSQAGNPFQQNPYVGSNVQPGPGIGGHGYLAAHRGSTILTLGIFALVCNMFLVPGIMAWIMGRSDMKEIDAGRMDPEGRGMTQAGTILGMIGTLLPLFFFLLYVGFIILVLIIGAAGTAGGAGF